MVIWTLYDYDNMKVVATSNRASGISTIVRMTHTYISRGELVKTIDNKIVRRYIIRDNKLISY